MATDPEVHDDEEPAPGALTGRVERLRRDLVGEMRARELRAMVEDVKAKGAGDPAADEPGAGADA